MAATGVEMSLAGPGVLCQALPCLSCSPRIDCQLGPSLPSLFAANDSAAIDLRKGASRSSTSLRCLMAAETSQCQPLPPPSRLHKRPPIPLGLPFPAPGSLAWPSPMLCPLSPGSSRRKEHPLAPSRPREVTSPFLSLVQLVGGPANGKPQVRGRWCHFTDRLNLGLRLPPTDFAPESDLGGEILPEAWLPESPLPQMPPHRALGEGREGLKMAPGGQGQLLAIAAVPGLDVAYPWACGAPSCPAFSLGKLDSLPRRNRQGDCY